MPREQISGNHFSHLPTAESHGTKRGKWSAREWRLLRTRAHTRFFPTCLRATRKRKSISQKKDYTKSLMLRSTYSRTRTDSQKTSRPKSSRQSKKRGFEPRLLQSPAPSGKTQIRISFLE